MLGLLLRTWLSKRLGHAVVVAMLSLALMVPAFAQSGDYQSRAKYAVLMDAATGAILYQKNADELVPPASLSKLMTLAVLFRTLKSGKLSATDEFVMSVNAWRKGGAPSKTSAMMVPVSTKVKLSELIQGIIVQSGNDACISVAEGIAGSEDNFAKLMTEEARRIGLKKSTFGNATGLPNPAQLMSARELGQLARFLIREYPEHYPVFGQKEFPYRHHKFINRNPLLFLSIGADGMKTGFIKEAGYGLVGSRGSGRPASDRRHHGPQHRGGTQGRSRCASSNGASRASPSSSCSTQAKSSGRRGCGAAIACTCR